MEKKKLRRLNYLTSVSPYVPGKILENVITSKWKLHSFLTNVPKQSKLIFEAHDLFDELGYNEQQREEYWLERIFQYQRKTNQYQKKPVKIRKDNKDTINYGHGRLGQGPTIRYPKKVRKTAWKRFYKLFPHLKKKK